MYYQQMEAASTISEINPNVKKVLIDVKVVYTSFAGQVEKTYNISKGLNDKYMCRVPCPNRECTEGYFYLSNVIFNAVKGGEAKSGTMICSGQEEKYKHTNGFHCDTTLTYRIEPIKSL